jgi:hypothetical protein
VLLPPLPFSPGPTPPSPVSTPSFLCPIEARHLSLPLFSFPLTHLPLPLPLPQLLRRSRPSSSPESPALRPEVTSRRLDESSVSRRSRLLRKKRGRRWRMLIALLPCALLPTAIGDGIARVYGLRNVQGKSLLLTGLCGWKSTRTLTGARLSLPFLLQPVS